MDETQQLIAEIDAFLARSGMAATTFGQRAVRNWQIVKQIKSGSNIGMKTAARLRGFMADYQVQEDQAARGMTVCVEARPKGPMSRVGACGSNARYRCV